MGFAFVHVGLASWSGEALGAVAGEAAGGVDADAVVLAGGTLFALVDVFRTIDALVSRSAAAGVRTIDGTGITNRIGVTRIAGACIVQVTQEAITVNLSRWTGLS
jgi:hypothetical protein